MDRSDWLKERRRVAEERFDTFFAAIYIVYGESVHEGGYHYYPQIEQVKGWLEQARFRLVAEAIGDDYHHFLVQKSCEAA
jgi:hypothetical protein